MFADFTDLNLNVETEAEKYDNRNPKTSPVSYDAATVKKAAYGKWPAILAALDPKLDQAINKWPNRGSCPVHGGTDGFRLAEG